MRLRRERRIANRIVKAERIELRGKMAEAANRLGEVERGNAGLQDRVAGCAGVRRGVQRVPSGPSGVQVANARRVASSTDEGSR